MSVVICSLLFDFVPADTTSKWKWPDIEGLHSFQGDLIHSAQWPENYDYKDRVVAVIGNGASGIQIVPAMQPDAKKLVHIVRTPVWIIPPHIKSFSLGEAGQIIRDVGLDKDEKFPPDQIARFQRDPAFYRRFVKDIEKAVNDLFPMVCVSLVVSHLYGSYGVFRSMADTCRS